MSLLLDALKEAEGHKRRTQASDVGDARGPYPPALDTAIPLALAADPAPVMQARASTTATFKSATFVPAPESVVQLRVNRNVKPAPAARPRMHVLIGLLAVTIAILGGAYLYLTATNSAPVTLVPRQAALTPANMPPPTTFVLTPPQLTPSAASSNASLARPAQSLVTPKLRRGAEVIVQTRPSPLLGAYAALRAGDLTLAEKLYKETLSGEPDQPDAHLGLAVIAQSRGETAIAMGHYRSVIEATPHHPRAWAGIADLAGDAEIDAMESRLRGLIADRPAASLHFALGNLVMRRSRWAEAQESYFAAFTSVPDNADYAFNLAVALDRLGKGSAAQTYYEKALALARDGRPVQFDVKAAGVRLTSLSAEAR